MVVASVPAKVRELLAVKVLPAAKVSVPVPLVMVLPLMVVAVNPPARVKAPAAVNLLAEEKNCTSPVLPSPNCRGFLAVAPMVLVVPAAEPKTRLPETEAVGVPVATLRTANLAAAVDCPPTKKSTVALLGTITPPVISAKGEEPAPPV